MYISLSNINTPRLSRQSLPRPRRISIAIYESLSVVNKQGAGADDLRSLPSGCSDRIIRLLTHSSHSLHYINSLLPLSVDSLSKVFVFTRGRMLDFNWGKSVENGRETNSQTIRRRKWQDKQTNQRLQRRDLEKWFKLFTQTVFAVVDRSYDRYDVCILLYGNKDSVWSWMKTVLLWLNLVRLVQRGKNSQKPRFSSQYNNKKTPKAGNSLLHRSLAEWLKKNLIPQMISDT